MPQRQYSREQRTVAKAEKRITLPIKMAEYSELAKTPVSFRAWLDGWIGNHPELFPSDIVHGYRLHDWQPASTKLPGVRFRRIVLSRQDEEGRDQVFTVASSDILPYMTGYTDEVEKALFLRRFGVPFWGLTYVFGRDDQYWYRLVARFGTYDLVDTTVKDPAHLPDNLLADEKHTSFNGEKAYIATTVGADCVLGASLALAADESALTQAYGHFKQEAQGVKPDYAPQTVNTDGWLPTQKAWCALFPWIVVLECFLHAFIKIRERCRRLPVFGEITRRVWDIYHAADAHAFLDQVHAFSQWAHQTVTGTALESITRLCGKADLFILAFDFPHAYRTSNMLDRHMEPLDRWLFGMRFFHGDWASAEKQVRSWALLHNFWPYCPRTRLGQQFTSPFHQLNGFVYHDNWLHNLLIAKSSTGLTAYHKIRQN